MRDKQKSPQRQSADPLAALSVETALRSVGAMGALELRKVWQDRFGRNAPNLRLTFLRQEFGWQMQAHVFGDLDAATEHKLKKIGESLEHGGAYLPQLQRKLPPGAVLTREWKGSIHKVTVEADGFHYRGRCFRSLSRVARTITGTRWSGPRFFGLKQIKRNVTA